MIIVYCNVYFQIYLSVSRETPESDNDATCAELINDVGFQSSMNNSGNSRPMSVVSEAATSASGSDTKRWVDIVSGLLERYTISR